MKKVVLAREVECAFGNNTIYVRLSTLPDGIEREESEDKNTILLLFLYRVIHCHGRFDFYGDLMMGYF